MGKFSSSSKPRTPPPVVEPEPVIQRQASRVPQSEIKRRQNKSRASGGGTKSASSSNTVFTPGTQGVGDSDLSTGKTLLGG
jgi:hypothetical protein